MTKNIQRQTRSPSHLGYSRSKTTHETQSGYTIKLGFRRLRRWVRVSHLVVGDGSLRPKYRTPVNIQRRVLSAWVSRCMTPTEYRNDQGSRCRICYRFLAGRFVSCDFLNSRGGSPNNLITPLHGHRVMLILDCRPHSSSKYNHCQNAVILQWHIITHI